MTTYDQISALMATSKVVGSNAFARTEGMPLDSSSVLKTYADLVEYAASSGKAYEGQIVAVGDTTIADEVSVYVLDNKAPDKVRIVGVPSNLDSHLEQIDRSIDDQAQNLSSLEDGLWGALSSIADYDAPSAMSFNEAVSAVFLIAKALKKSRSES